MSAIPRQQRGYAIRPDYMRNFLLLFTLLVSLSAQASNLITATITVTNAPSDGDTLVVNGSTRTWKTVVGTAATQVLIDAAIGGNATNLYNQVASYSFTTLTLGHSGGTGITLRGIVDQTIAVSITGTWGTYSLATNVTTASKPVMSPASSYQTITDATNIYSQVVSDLVTFSTNTFPETTAALVNFVSLQQSQSISNKTFTDSTVWNGLVKGSFLTNVGLAYSQTNGGIQFFASGASSPVYAVGPDAAGIPSLWSVSMSAATNRIMSAPAFLIASENNFLTFKFADGRYGTLLGRPSNTWTGTNTFTGPGITNSVIGTSTITNSTIYGTLGLLSGGTLDGSAVTNASYHGTIVKLSSGYLDGVGATNLLGTNQTWKGTSDFVGDVAIQRLNHTALSNGANADADFGTSSFVKIKAGPTAVFSIAGIAAPRNGRKIIIYNNTGFAMTISNESGTEPTPANRILTLSGADYSTTGDGAVTVIYDSDASRWILIGKVD